MMYGFDKNLTLGPEITREQFEYLWKKAPKWVFNLCYSGYWHQVSSFAVSTKRLFLLNEWGKFKSDYARVEAFRVDSEYYPLLAQMPTTLKEEE